MFEHESFVVHEFDQVPKNEESYMMDESLMQDYENAMLNSFSTREYVSVDPISDIVARRINENSIELSWFPDVLYTFHEVTIDLPRDQFVTCVSCPIYGERPHIFVKSSWYEHLHLRQYSVFCWIDAIGVKNALKNGLLNYEKLINLRDAIDKLAAKYSDVSFISFADNVILKSNWTVGHFESNVSYTYNPEYILDIVKDVRKVYNEILGLDIYAIFTQGSNAYYEDSLTHISDTKNHISLNSFGIPFAQLIEIDTTVKLAIKEKTHKASELYLDLRFLNSLKFRLGYDKDSLDKNKYFSSMTSLGNYYYCIDWEELLENLRSNFEKGIQT